MIPIIIFCFFFAPQIYYLYVHMAFYMGTLLNRKRQETPAGLPAGVSKKSDHLLIAFRWERRLPFCYLAFVSVSVYSISCGWLIAVVSPTTVNGASGVATGISKTELPSVLTGRNFSPSTSM